MERKVYQILRDVINDFETGAIQKEQEVKKEPERLSALQVGKPLKRYQDSKGYWLQGVVKRGGLEDPVFQEFIRDLHNRPEQFIGNLYSRPVETIRNTQTPTYIIDESIEARRQSVPERYKRKESRIVAQVKKETPSVKKVTVESLPESWGNITLDQAKAELQDYYNQIGEQKDVSKMSNEDFINEFNNYLEYQNSKLNDQYYQTKPLVIQQQEQPRQEQPKYANVDLSRKEVRDILNLYGYNPYRDFTASQRRAIRKRAAGNKDLDMEWLRNFDHTLNGESLYDFFVTYRKRGGKLISNNIVERFKNRYKI